MCTVMGALMAMLVTQAPSPPPDFTFIFAVEEDEHIGEANQPPTNDLTLIHRVISPNMSATDAFLQHLSNR